MIKQKLNSNHANDNADSVDDLRRFIYDSVNKEHMQPISQLIAITVVLIAKYRSGDFSHMLPTPTELYINTLVEDTIDAVKTGHQKVLDETQQNEQELYELFKEEEQKAETKNL